MTKRFIEGGESPPLPSFWLDTAQRFPDCPPVALLAGMGAADKLEYVERCLAGLLDEVAKENGPGEHRLGLVATALLSTHTYHIEHAGELLGGVPGLASI